MKTFFITFFLLMYAFCASLGSSGLPDDVKVNFDAVKMAQNLDKIITQEQNNYEAIQNANQMDYEAKYGPTDDEIESLDFMSLYFIDMNLINKKIEMDERPLIVQLDETIDILAEKHGVDPKLVKAVIRIESFYNPQAVSNRGACGLMQLMPSTAKQMGVKDIFNPIDNIIGGIKYLKYLQSRYKYKSEKLILAAYNAGPGNVRKHRGVPPFPETIDYIKKVREFKRTI